VTIAACHVSSEGVVVAADSTTTTFVPGPGGELSPPHHYNYSQKVFEFGDVGSTAGVVLWGLSVLGSKSYRTLIAEIADEAKKQNLASLDKVAEIAVSMFWDEYSAAFEEQVKWAQELEAKGEERTEEENDSLARLKEYLSGGFCLGGRWGAGRSPRAFATPFGPVLTSAPSPRELAVGDYAFWGCPALVERLWWGISPGLFQKIVESGRWTGTSDDLLSLIADSILHLPRDLPLREAIDWIYSTIYITIKAIKFSHLLPVCGGPIEIAVITTDRPFRWVRHKRLGEAIAAYETREDWHRSDFGRSSVSMHAP